MNYGLSDVLFRSSEREITSKMFVNTVLFEHHVGFVYRCQRQS